MEKEGFTIRSCDGDAVENDSFEVEKSQVVPDIGHEILEDIHTTGENQKEDVENISLEIDSERVSPQSIVKDNKRVTFSREKQEYWERRRDLVLEKEYSRIAPDIPLVNVSQKDIFLQKCKEYYEEIMKDVEGIRKIDRWDEYEIIRMFGKGLNPTSLKTALNDINFLVDNIIPDENVVRVVEFGPGSGWSTLMLRNQLHKRFPDKDIELISVDISPHSIVSTQNSLDYYQIPWQTEINDGNVENISKKTEFITLVLDDFVEFSKKQPDNYFSGFFSSHGTAYLSEGEYEELLRVVKAKGKNGAIFVADSLDPLYTVKLDTAYLVLCSLFPSISKSREEYSYGKSLVSNSKYFPGQEVKKLTRVNNKESALFYNWNNFLLSKLKIKYIIQMLKSIRITTDVIEEYREDVYPSYLVNRLVEKENLSEWKRMENLPECPLYITNCGLILKK
jgi:hypothetical protein